MNRIKKLLRITLFVLPLVLFLAEDVQARAGGAGGSRRSSGSSRSSRSSSSRSYSSSSYRSSSSHSSSSSAGPVEIFFVIMIAGVIISIHLYDKQKAKTQENFIPKKKKSVTQPSFKKRRVGVKGLQKRNPDFSEELFLEKARTAFLAIQNAWDTQNLTQVRHFLSDGVWQRFHVQFLIMEQLKQKNNLSNITIEDIGIDRVERDGEFEKVNVAIKASLDDHFICELDHSLDSGGRETFVEYWSFIKKRSSETKDLYSSQTCPSCGANLEGTLGEVAQCDFCGTVVNSGEFDWILSEITQAVDYHSKGNCTEAQNLKIRKKMLQEADADFSVQLIEDKVSNGYLQLLAAEVLQRPEMVKRFTGDIYFEEFQKKVKEKSLIYDRLFLNDVSLLAAKSHEDKNYLYVSVTASFKRVRKEKGSLVKLDPSLITRTQIVELARDISFKTNKGSLVMHRCSSCGAKIEDTLDVTCSYCSAVLNSGAHDWVITNILSAQEYSSMVKKDKKEFSLAANPAVIKSIMSTREYAINNIMVVLSADGKLTDEELRFLRDVAQQLKFRAKECDELIEKAKQNQLQLRMPEDLVQRKKVYDLMIMAAEADGTVSPEEQQVLDYIENEFLQICPV